MVANLNEQTPRPVDVEKKVETAPPNPTSFEGQYAPARTKTILSDKLEQLLLLVYFAIGALLLFRFVLSLFGANRETLFVDFVYQLTTPFMFAFEGMFSRQPSVGSFVLEFEVLVALLVYALVFVGLGRLMRIIFR